MTCRLSHVWMFALALLGLLAATAACLSAKPPDLPVDPNNEVAPIVAPLPEVDEFTPPVYSEKTAAPMEMQETITIYHPVRSSVPLSVQLVFGECMLFGAHPLLSMVPISDCIEEEHTVEMVLWPVPRPVFAISDDGYEEPIMIHHPVRSISPPPLWRTFKKCLLYQAHPLLSLVQVTAWLEEEQTQEMVPLVPTSVCPWMNAPACDRRVPALADAEMSHTVLQNLEDLVEAEKFYQQATKLASCGQYVEAMECLTKVCSLCPGSRFEEMSVELVAKIVCHVFSPSDEEADAEESEDMPPTQCLPNWSDDEELQEPSPEDLSRATPAKLATEMERKLATLVNVNFKDVPLRKALDDFRRVYGVKFWIDECSLDKAGISLNQPVTVELEGLSLKTIIEYILRNKNLAYVVHETVIEVTTKEKTWGPFVRKVYCVGDILACKGNYGVTPDKLIKLILNTVNQPSWSDLGGKGTIDYFPVSQVLVINQYMEVQEQVLDLLQEWRRRQVQEAAAKKVEEHACPCCKPCQMPGIEEQAKGAPVSPYAPIPLTYPGPGVEEQVTGLMKACHLALSDGCHHKAADLARQAYALNPERVAADPVVYKMHLLALKADHCPACCEECEHKDCCCPVQQLLPTVAQNLRKLLIEDATAAAKPSLEVVEEESEVREVPKASDKPFCLRSTQTGNVFSCDELLRFVPGETWTELDATTNHLRILWRVRIGDMTYCVRYDGGDVSFGRTVTPCGHDENCEEK